jgi:hypothetical protein
MGMKNKRLAGRAWVRRVVCRIAAAVALTVVSGCYTLADAPELSPKAAESGNRFPMTRDTITPLFGVFSGDSTADLESAVDVIRAAKAANRVVLSLLLRPGTETVTLTAGTDLGEEGLVLDSANSPASVIIDGGGREIRLGEAANRSLITVESGVTLTLRNIALRGDYFYGRNAAPLIHVAYGGRLILETGAALTGNYVFGVSCVSGGGGVYAAGELTMRDGIISDNTYDGSLGAGRGGGVYVADTGTFYMSGGIIRGNYATNGGASNVSVVSGRGGGVYVEDGGFFAKTGSSVIYGDKDRNHASNNPENTARSGAANGHAVYYARDNGYYCDSDLNEGEDLSSDIIPASGAGNNWTKK